MEYNREMDSMIKTIQNHATRDGDNPISPRVIHAIRQVPRHRFVTTSPYKDHPVHIGHSQTISQPFIVAYMTEMLELQPLHKVLEIGMGSGYQAAVLSELSQEIYTVERIPELAIQTKTLLEQLEYENINIKVGNGVEGWEEHAPYDRIIVTATASDLIPPQMLVDQLVDGGKMIIPMRRSGEHKQLIATTKIHATNTITQRSINIPYEELVLVTKTGNTYTEKSLIGVRFVPLINEV